MSTIFILTEENERVATGHLMECIVCAEELIKEGYSVSFWINTDAQDDLKKRIPCQYQEYTQAIDSGYEHFLEQVVKIHPQSIIFNLRCISESFLDKIRVLIPQDIKIICIDEFGHRELSPDVIINPMIDSYYWDYGKSKAKLFCGAEYLILPQKLEELHLKEKVINKEIKNVIISMGGVDPKNYTLGLLEIVPQFFKDSVINVIIGGGNQHNAEVFEKVGKSGNVNLYKNVTNLLQMMFDMDLLICAGGNTLHEAACIGIPAIIIPSMPHEKSNANYFRSKGFGYVVDTEHDFHSEVLNACLRLQDVQGRERTSQKGKIISDGLGRKRVIEIIEKEI